MNVFQADAFVGWDDYYTEQRESERVSDILIRKSLKKEKWKMRYSILEYIQVILLEILYHGK